MPISGPVVHQQLMDAYSNAQVRLEQERTLQDSTKQRDDLEDSRGEALVKLAEHYLPELSTEAVRKTWVEVRSDLAQVLRRKEQETTRVRGQLSDANERRHHLEAELMGVNSQCDDAVEQMQEVSDQVEQELRQSAEFVTLSDRAAKAEAALERAEANLQEIDQDAARKLPAYEQSTLFGYLKDQSFGTSQYGKRGLTRRMDRWLARYIDYSKAKQGYDFLKNTPEQMREIIAQDRQSLDVVMAELERHRDRVATQKGLPDEVNRVHQARERRDEKITEVDAATEQTRQIESQLTDLEDPRGPYYREAISVFRNTLQRFDTRELSRRARQTAELSDDQIVAGLIGADSQLNRLDQEVQQQHERALHMQSMMNSLGQLIQRFRALQFDSARSQFVGTLDVTDALYRAQDEQDVEDLWQTIRSAQRWGPNAMEQITRVATHPMTQVLINAMAHAAGGALEAHARRAGHRRGRRW
ncbi:hypothetical protein [Novipirellula artificiosorum]|uniref:Chromosome partition protein Smc n=1 Tax=Novipirellula artificiosorum TaxID=2528016 RepID=A0A5C6DD49_9BACT|nr:hypothetical protein [Novipirellula artificiosorum]TWU35163.1 hypothetical protein Poly41_43120 [Novipirellula artificiosorum]